MGTVRNRRGQGQEIERKGGEERMRGKKGLEREKKRETECASR